MIFGEFLIIAGLAGFVGFVLGIFAEQADNGQLKERYVDWRERRKLQRHLERERTAIAAGAIGITGPNGRPICRGCRHPLHVPGQCPTCPCGYSRAAVGIHEAWRNQG